MGLLGGQDREMRQLFDEVSATLARRLESSGSYHAESFPGWTYTADNVVLDQNVLVINTGDKLALFETGMSSVKRNDAMGRLVTNLKQSGIDPNDIDAVIPTHAHIDHVGGIMAALQLLNQPGSVRVERRVGARVYLRVQGKLVPSLAVTGLSTTYHDIVNPFGGGSMMQ